ncbi:aldo/keto reductase [Neolewinella aurantiaca]|uniref:Aldo/keto reductase n=2 Tax=Neolewinella aurantiaca TaxID=2602767 RepID=A0A5C7F8V3_9BACT|nr:aldo/keto reductase [Neolewinella aurantiaca]
MNAIDQVNLSSDGPNLSRIVAGTMTWGEWGIDYSASEIADMIGHCLDLGITSFDHADIYGHYSTEASFGHALNKLGTSVRAQMELITKCGIRLETNRRPENRLKSYDLSRDYIIASAEQSLKNLQTDYLDLFLLHRPSPLMNPAEIAEAFTHLEQSGKVRSFGVSNFTPSQFGLLSQAVTLVTNQVECHPLHPDCFYDGTFDQLLAANIRPMVWSPLGGAKYFKGESTTVLRLRDTVKTLAEKYGNVGEDVILLAWLLKHPVGAIPVVGTTKKERLTGTRLALDLELETQDWFAILEAAVGHEVA